MASTPTFATVAVFDMDADRSDEQLAILKERIIPGVAASPGFVAAYWAVNQSRDVSNALVLFESEATASRFADSVQANEQGRQGSGCPCAASMSWS